LQKRQVGTALRACLEKTDLGFNLPLFDGQKIDVEVWKLNYGRAVTYFLAAPPVTAIVYPGC
jgi:hypothetical protein